MPAKACNAEDYSSCNPSPTRWQNSPNRSRRQSLSAPGRAGPGHQYQQVVLDIEQVIE
jgi:hypothetical protein